MSTRTHHHTDARDTTAPTRSDPTHTAPQTPIVARWSEWIGRRLRSAGLESMHVLAAAAEAKDPYARCHAQAVAAIAHNVAGRLALPAGLTEAVRTAALLHDIGKIGVPDAVLTKPGPLTQDEFDVVKRHPQAAITILSHVSWLRDELPMIRHHHERFDGTGYPDGLVAADIPIGARIIAVADAIDAMLSARSYKPPCSIDRVLAELDACAGTQFDPDVAAAGAAWCRDAARRPTRRGHAVACRHEPTP
ncbi:MAG: HD-GYP domain-containing protein [Phycisphaerae bacterium]